MLKHNHLLVFWKLQMQYSFSSVLTWLQNINSQHETGLWLPQSFLRFICALVTPYFPISWSDLLLINYYFTASTKFFHLHTIYEIVD